MKKKIIGTLCILAVTLAIGVSNVGVLKADGIKPGSSSDPVVTKGYVDQAISEKTKSQEEMIGLLNTQLNALKSELAGLKEEASGDHTYKVVEVEPGERLIGQQGTEIILRAGQGTAIVGALGGLQDVTEGVDITEGFIPKYHLLITPRDDGRGVRVTKKATFMVRGGYSIK